MTMTPTTDLTSLMQVIGDGFPFTQEKYPNGDLSTPEKTLAFAVRHSSAHIAKTGGIIAAQAENYDHGGELDPEALRMATTKMLVNTLNLANALGMTAQDLVSLVPSAMR
ncbi:MAG: hypothetical protein AB202_02105 [Parcubacteria bacterium C7867-007]|nr:MAG: hypothetical protein AB202_02105 [Parcubacteria bacterium C7867-007]